MPSYWALRSGHGGKGGFLSGEFWKAGVQVKRWSEGHSVGLAVAFIHPQSRGPGQPLAKDRTVVLGSSAFARLGSLGTSGATFFTGTTFSGSGGCQAEPGTTLELAEPLCMSQPLIPSCN